MKKFRVSRIYVQRWSWIVEANSEEEAEAMLDDEDKTPSLSADEEWLGSAHGYDQYEDSVEEIKEEK